MTKWTKGMREVQRVRRILDTAMDAVEDENPREIIRFAESLSKERFHNPWWIGIVAMAVGRALIKAPILGRIAMMRRLGWTMIGLGGANTAKEVAEWSLSVVQQVADLKSRFGDRSAVSEQDVTGGIGEP